MGTDVEQIKFGKIELSEPRYKLRIAIYYGTDPQQRMSNYAVNMSAGGVFIETAKPLASDTPLFVEFMLPIKGIHITCKARVAWVNTPGAKVKPSLPPGMGLQFIDLSLEDVHHIRLFLNEYDFKPIW